jgi:hypothetical protein
VLARSLHKTYQQLCAELGTGELAYWIALSEIEQHEVEHKARQAQQREARLAFHGKRV